MTVEFNATVGQGISFATPTAAKGLTQRTIRIVYEPTALSNAIKELFLIIPTGGSDELMTLVVDYGNAAGDSGKITLIIGWSGGVGEWYTTSDVLTAGVRNEIFITYDGSSSANNPVMYVNNSVVTLTRRSAPSGSLLVGTNSTMYVGAVSVASPNGKVHICQYFNKVLSTEERGISYDSRLFMPIRSGIVFCPNLHGPAGTIKDGDTMAAGNTIRDLISGNTGTPAGTPVFRNNNVYSLGGE